ncbi:MAG: phospholipase D family protein [Bacteroidetes bacterium MedPE-SWsnd-G2]|nr:MAG: phospholipase D family protein [Bacteroidetes bacterium MedPE-SWsnd-G2]
MRTFLFYISCISIIVLSSCKEENKVENTIALVDAIDCNDTNFINQMDTVLKPIDSLLKHKTGVYVMEDGGNSMISRAWFTKHAQKTIDIQYFIFSTDNVGLIACDFLVKAADRGLKIRILVDDIMVDASLQEVLTLDTHPNISIKIYNPGINLGKNIFNKLSNLATDFRDSNQRMHNKTFIVDDKIVITGGRNIADEYFDYDHDYNFRDRDVLLLGKASKSVSNSFDEFWAHDLSVPVISLSKEEEIISNENTFNALNNYACNADNFWPQVRQKVENYPLYFQSLLESNKIEWLDTVNFISDIPGKNDGTGGMSGGGLTTSTLIKLVNEAQSTIEIQSPYLVTSELSRNLFQAATNRGVEVRILTNSLASTDNIEAFSGYQSDRVKLLETGVKIFEYKPDAQIRKHIMSGAIQQKIDFTPIFGLHAKSMVIDNKTVVIGTFNLDPRSANLNTECLTIFDSENVAKTMLLLMEEEFLPENSWETTKDFNPDKQVTKMKRFKTWTRKILPKNIL